VPTVSGASESTQRVSFVNVNWSPGDPEGEFAVLVVTEDGERHVVPLDPVALVALTNVLRLSSVQLWDPVGRTLVAANLVGQWIPDDWSAATRGAGEEPGRSSPAVG